MLPVSKGHDSILVVCNKFSKMSHFVVTTEKITVEGLVKLFRDNVWKLHGLLVMKRFGHGQFLFSFSFIF